MQSTIDTLVKILQEQNRLKKLLLCTPGFINEPHEICNYLRACISCCHLEIHTSLVGSMIKSCFHVSSKIAPVSVYKSVVGFFGTKC